MAKNINQNLDILSFHCNIRYKYKIYVNAYSMSVKRDL